MEMETLSEFLARQPDKTLGKRYLTDEEKEAAVEMLRTHTVKQVALSLCISPSAIYNILRKRNENKNR